MICWCKEIRDFGNKNYYCVDCEKKVRKRNPELEIYLKLFKKLSLKENRTEIETKQMFDVFAKLCNWNVENPFDENVYKPSPWDDEFFSRVADDFLKLQMAKADEPKMWDLIQEKADMELIIESRKHFNTKTGNEDQIDDLILVRAINKLIEVEKDIDQIKSNYAWQRNLATKPKPPVKKDIPNLAPGG